MADNNTKVLILHSSSILVFFFSVVVILEVASARPLIINPASTLSYPSGLTKLISPPEVNNSSEKKQYSGIAPPEFGDASHRKLGLLAYNRPSLMGMLPRGRIPVSGPSRRINDANN